MKIKKYIPVALLASTVLVTTSCKDSFLEVTSYTQEFLEEYFTTDEHVQEAVVAAYDPLQWPDWSDGQYAPVNIISDVMADQIWVGGADRTDNQFWHLMSNYEALPTNCLSSLWSEAFSGVKRCNDVLLYITGDANNAYASNNISEANKKYYEAQARVLRVFYYNWLWKFWGNIPYFESNLTAASNYMTEQLDHDAVYNKMVEDLEGAIAIDVLPMRETSANYGRVTKAMAYMLYAEIVMYQKDTSRYPTALAYMKEIINSGKYDLANDYTEIFKESGEWNIESIWEINYKDDSAARSYNNPKYAGGTVLPRLIGPNNYVGNGTDGHANGWGFAPVRLETVNMFADNDARKDATCWNAKATGSYGERYQDTGYFLEKYAPYWANNADQIADTDLNYNNNLRIYRFSETLLNAAELILLTGGNRTDADKYLNKVHERATGETGLTATDATILQERALEFVGEGKRYWDLVRTGNAPTVLVPDSYGYRTNSWTESKKYLPIPQGEMDAAQGTLKQNNY